MTESVNDPYDRICSLIRSGHGRMPHVACLHGHEYAVVFHHVWFAPDVEPREPVVSLHDGDFLYWVTHSHSLDPCVIEAQVTGGDRVRFASAPTEGPSPASQLKIVVPPRRAEALQKIRRQLLVLLEPGFDAGECVNLQLLETYDAADGERYSSNLTGSVTIDVRGGMG